MPIKRRAPRIPQIYAVELSLRPYNNWEAILPANMSSLEGMLSSNPHWKRKREILLKEAGVTVVLEQVSVAEQALNDQLAKIATLTGQAEQLVAAQAEAERLRAELQPFVVELQQRRQTAGEQFDRLVKQAAGGILEQLTMGMAHQGEDSLIPSDQRFKRTRAGRLFIGAGSLVTSITEAAFSLEDDAGLKRRLQSRLFISPGKVVIYRWNESHTERLFLNKADGRRERHVPPGPPDPRMNFRRKPSTINYPEYVGHPAHLHFYLWMAPDVEPPYIRQYLEVAAELGIYGYHSHRQGKFDVVEWEEVGPMTLMRLITEQTKKIQAGDTYPFFKNVDLDLDWIASQTVPS